MPQSYSVQRVALCGALAGLAILTVQRMKSPLNPGLVSLLEFVGEAVAYGMLFAILAAAGATVISWWSRRS